ncbi:MAG TPA: phosphatidylinositol mannoside acyltransferase [Jatrophihabitans sp.]|nr:phosphatidylinositol mannoside acyltransferase [Jatrophihabitans sp.]
MLENARHRAVDFGYAAGWGVVRGMPRGMSERAFRAVADAAAVRNGGGAQQLRKNLRRVVGPAMSELRMDALVGAALRSYARYWLETFRLPAMDLDAVAAGADACTFGGEHIWQALERGNGAVLALPHSGNWDVAGVWLVDKNGPFTTVAERLKPDSLFDRFVAYRESLGMEVVALTGGERPPFDVLAERLRQNKVVCLLADRDLSRHGIEVQFFGEAARMPAGPALLAARTGASLHAVHCWFEGEQQWGQSVSPPLTLPGERLREQVAAGTQALADHFAASIAEHPADWHMLQRLWVADLQARPQPSAPAAAGAN